MNHGKIGKHSEEAGRLSVLACAITAVCCCALNTQP